MTAEHDSFQRRVRAAMTDVMGDFPRSASYESRRATPSVNVGSAEHLKGFTRTRIDYESEPGCWVPAYLLVPHTPLQASAHAETGTAARCPAALCLHQTTAIGKGEPAGLGGLENLRYAAELAARGFVTLAPDYPGFGDSDTDPYPLGYASTTLKGVWNHMRAVDLLASLPYVDEKRIACIGHSLGGHNALFVSAFDPRLAVTVTSCGFTSFARYREADPVKWESNCAWAQDKYMPRIRDIYQCDPARIPFDFCDILAAVAPRSIFVNAPLHDGNFDNRGVRESISAAAALCNKTNTELDIATEYPDCGHDFPPDTRMRSYAFIEHKLGTGVSN